MSNRNPLFKVVTAQLTSVVTRNAVSEDNQKNPFVLTYSETELVSGHQNSKVFCFDNLDDARMFNRTDANGCGRIYEVETRGRREYPKRIASLSVSSLLKFWQRRANHNRGTREYGWSTMCGTVLVRSVRLAKRVY